MPFPAGVPTVTITKDYRTAAGSPPTKAAVRFTPSVRKVVTAENLTIEPVTVEATVTNGLMSVVLAATEGFSYRVDELVDGNKRPSFSILCPAATPAPIYVLDELAPVEPVDPAYVPVRTVEGVGPDASGNVDLDLSGGGGGGEVPSSRTIATTNGLQGGGDLSANRTLSPVYGTVANTICQGNDARLSDARTPTAHGHPISDVTSLQTSLDGKAATSHTHPQSDVTGLTAALDLKAPLASPTFTGTVAGVTKTHVGLGNVDNTTDAGKPISTATQTALDLKAPLASPTFTGTVSGVTKTHVGLSNVDNTTDAGKPISTATQTALDNKSNTGHTHGAAPGGIQELRQAWITSGDISPLPNTAGAWAPLSGFVLAIPAAVGDYVELDVNAMRRDTVAGNAFLDLGVLDGSSIVRFLSSGGATPGLEGDPGWYVPTVGIVGRSGPRGFEVTAGDLDAGEVRFCVAVKSNATGVLYASTNYPFYWRAVNYGPVSTS